MTEYRIEDPEVVKVEFLLSKGFLEEIYRIAEPNGYEDRGEFIRSAVRKQVHLYREIELLKQGYRAQIPAGGGPSSFHCGFGINDSLEPFQSYIY